MQFFCPLDDANLRPKESPKEANKTLESSSDDNGGFITPPDAPKLTRVKRATVVGNPMFSNTPDSELGPGESLGLDDLDMDYEQIMHYFDNLKVGELYLQDFRRSRAPKQMKFF